MSNQQEIQLFTTSSGMGGVFTVSIVEDRGDDALVRVWHGIARRGRWESWKDFDGMTFQSAKADLRPAGRMSLSNPTGLALH